jgi:cytochrome P450
MSGSADRYAAVDWFTDGSVVDDPYPYYRYLRDDRGPVWIEPTHGVAVVTGHDEALAVYRDHETYSSCNAVAGPFGGLPVMPEGDDANALIDEHRSSMPMAGYMATWDPPQHSEYRSLLTGLFTPKRLKENEDFMWRLAAQQLDEFVDRGRCEFIREFAEPFTALVIADLLGVPADDRARFRAWFQAQKSPGQIDENLTSSDDTNALSFFESTFTGYIEDRRRSPRDDVLTHLAQVTFPDGTVPPVSVLANEAAFLFAAGQETTARSLTFALQHLVDFPELQEALRADRATIPTFVEEIFRLEAPVKSHFRLARRTTSLGGVDIPAGTTVMLLIGGINRDPRRFDDPDVLDLERDAIYEHVAFARGVHTCLGQQLARAEMRIALELLLDRTTDIRISTADHGPREQRRYEYDPTFFFRGLRALRVELTAAPELSGAEPRQRNE